MAYQSTAYGRGLGGRGDTVSHCGLAALEEVEEESAAVQRAAKAAMAAAAARENYAAKWKAAQTSQPALKLAIRLCSCAGRLAALDLHGSSRRRPPLEQWAPRRAKGGPRMDALANAN